MIDAALPARSIPATSDGFRRDAELAGIKLQERLPNDSEKATRFPGFDSYNARHYLDIMGKVMDDFAKNEFQRLHPGQDLVWGAIRLITRDETAGDIRNSKAAEETWAMPLSGENSTIGQPLNRNDIPEVKEGQIFLGYKINA